MKKILLALALALAVFGGAVSTSVITANSVYAYPGGDGP
jgi:hypothetical protein